MPRPIAAPTPSLPACAGVGVVKDSAAIAPASTAPFPICPKRLETVWFVLMALSALQFQVRQSGYWLAPPDRHVAESAANLPQVSVVFCCRSERECLQ